MGTDLFLEFKYLVPFRDSPQATGRVAKTVPNISFVEKLNQW